MKDKESFKSENSEIVQELQSQLAKKDEILNMYRSDHGKLELFFNKVTDAIDPITPIAELYKPKTDKGDIIPVMHVTDTHMGEVQEPYEIEGFNAFNPDIAHARNMDFAKRALKWIDRKRNSYAVNDLVMLFTGDLISGDIHQELQVTNAYPSPVQVAESAKSHAQQIALLAPYFRKITVHFVSEDNHARLTKKPQAKEAGRNSFNYLVGVLLDAYLSKHDNVEFNLYPMLEKVVTVGKMKYLISHGHNIKGWAGIPWYGIERKVGKEAQARLQLIMDEIERAKTIGFDKYVIGHFHVPTDNILYSVGGSLSGTSAFDHQAGRYAYPCQSAWVVGSHGEFDRINFKLNV